MIVGAMPELPEGTVTFLFTDIEGSTALLRELGDRYADVLAEHRGVLRNAVEGRGGVVFGSEGDAVFCAFPEATDAIAAAADAQRGLERLPLRVRMGVHTGEPAVRAGDYVGIDVHRVARITATGHGGQVVVSQATRSLVDDDFTFRDLGEHRLKDLPEAEWLYQLGDADFPPLRSLSNTNLPAPPTPLVGRRRELDELVELLRREEARLVTVTGPGGTGKTRLAVAVAAELSDAYPNGVFFVALAPVADAALVVPEIAQTLGVSEQSGEPLERTLARRLEQRTLLLVLDNVEQVLDAAPEIADLLQGTSGLHVLATSREPLRIRGEREYALEPLAADEALRLFVERAQAVRSDFSLNGDEPIARDICERLDRLPLAIELAAARVKLLSLPAIAKRLEQRLSFVASTRRDLPARHRTLRGAIEWSYDLLEAGERTLFARLAIFAGGWTLEAAEAVCDADLDTLASLLDKSLVARAEDERFAMLATIREYAWERLDACEDADAVRGAHADYFLELVRGTEGELEGSGQVEALALLEREHDNLRAALAWALANRPDRGVRLAGLLGSFWYMHTHVLEGCSWLQQALDADEGGDALARARVLHWLGVLNDLRRDEDAARRLLEEAVALYAQTEERSRHTRALNSLGIVTRNGGDLRRARELLTECLAMRRELGEPGMISVTTCDLGIVAFDEGDLDAAESLFEESLAIDSSLGDSAGIAINTGNLGWLALTRGQVDRAAELIGQALRGFLEVGDREGLAEALEQAAALGGRRGQASQGARLAGAAAALREAVGVPWASVYDRRRIERELDAMRAELGDEAFHAAYEDGRGVDAEVAAEEALARFDPAHA
jgi:predicted ATPase/class 3 adenylate cyclase